MELADHVADRARRFLRLRVRPQTELRHRVDDAALDRLQTVRNMRQGPIQNDVHRVVEVRLTCELADRKVLDVGKRGRWWVERELLFGFTGRHRFSKTGHKVLDFFVWCRPPASVWCRPLVNSGLPFI